MIRSVYTLKVCSYSSNMASSKKKRVSKKNKSAWRKHVDISDVEKFLEDKRQDERLGEKLDGKQNEDLFHIDSVGDASIREKLQNTPADIKPLVRKSLRVKESETPKCFSVLERRSAVPDPVIKRNHLKQKEKVKKIQLTPQKKVPVKKKTEKMCRDIWNEVDVTRDLNGLSEWLTPDTVRHTLHNTGFKNRKKSNSVYLKPSPIAAVAAPHPGMSYNPSLADHRNLLQAVADAEAAEVMKEAHLARVTRKMFRKVPVEEAERVWREEMLVGLVQSSDSEMETGDYTTVNPPTVRKKKTLQKRRKLKEERARKVQQRKEKIERKKRADVNERLPKLQKEIVRSEENSAKFLARKQIRLEQKETEAKTLGPTKFEEPLLEFQLPSDIKGSLRKLAPEGSILMDRYRSLQKRSVVEPTLKRKIRNGKVKRFIKREHRDE